jgi:tRNA(Ile)-lysidine synthase
LFEAEFRRAWSRFSVSDPLVLLLSGGGDSVALFHLLRLAGIDFRALHFVHDGSAEFAERSRTFCADLCHDYGVALEVLEIAGHPLSQAGDLSWEAACRKLRYEAVQSRPGTFLTAHTLDDQAETVLMRLLAGSGLAGLSGIHEVRDDGILRPLLRFERERLRQFLQAGAFRWLEDPSNVDGNERARIRSKVLPALQADYPALKSTLGRTASFLAEDEACLEASVEEWLSRHTGVGGDNWLLSEVQELPRALQARFLKRLWRSAGNRAYRPRGTLYEQCFRLLERGTNEGEVPFPGGWAVKILGAKVWLALSSGEPLPEVTLKPLEREVAVTSYLSLSPRPVPGAAGWRLPAEGVLLRSRRPGDRFEGRSVKKLLAQTGHPPWVRECWPMLEKEGRVVAVWGRGGESEFSRQPNCWVNFCPSKLRVSVWDTPQKDDLFQQ